MIVENDYDWKIDSFTDTFTGKRTDCIYCVVRSARHVSTPIVKYRSLPGQLSKAVAEGLPEDTQLFVTFDQDRFVFVYRWLPSTGSKVHMHQVRIAPF